uniref:Uncharacterized protein n=1 Tax=Colobus angolensis palliatus TaxID=336983 RepID=A0A2K5K1G9_COLAP
MGIFLTLCFPVQKHNTSFCRNVSHSVTPNPSLRGTHLLFLPQADVVDEVIDSLARTKGVMKPPCSEGSPWRCPHFTCWVSQARKPGSEGARERQACVWTVTGATAVRLARERQFHTYVWAHSQHGQVSAVLVLTLPEQQWTDEIRLFQKQRWPQPS